MIKHKVINLVDAKVTAIAHQANCFHIMGGGVARAIREKYPEAYAADVRTRKGDKKKLGTFSEAVTDDGKRIFNVYSQYDLAGPKNMRATQYDMVDIGLRAVCDQLHEGDILGLPYKYGCALGGGSWPIVEAIIYDVFESADFNVILCEWPAPTAPVKSGFDSIRDAIERARGGPAPTIQQIGFA